MAHAELLALEFATRLADRDYSAAHAILSRSERGRLSASRLQVEFETIVPTDWGDVDPIELGPPLPARPDLTSDDVGWFYVSLGGDVYSEGLTLIVCREGDALRIREVEFGRP